MGDQKMKTLTEIGAEFGITPKPDEPHVDFAERIVMQLNDQVEHLQDRIMGCIEAVFPQPTWDDDGSQDDLFDPGSNPPSKTKE